MALTLFWVAAGLVLLNYALYPLFLLLLGHLKPGREKPAPQPPPDVSVMIAVRNEEKHISSRIDNLLASDYPGSIEILVGSDASDDATDAIAASRAADGVRLFRSDVRAGKPRILQMLAVEARASVFVFTDADTVFGPDTLSQLVAPFSDPSVGCVDGSRQNSLGGETCESVYWRYERWIKSLCSRIGAVLGATGAVFALRREAYEPLAPDRSDDFELAVMARILGFRAVFNPAAVAMEPAPDDSLQYRRMVRIVSWMSVSGIKLFARAFSAGRMGLALQLVVHKMTRWLTGYIVICATIAAAFLWAVPFYRIALLAMIAFHLLAAAGALLRGRLPGKLLFPYYFWLMNWASMVGIARAAAWRPVETWDRAARRRAGG
jgi:cellulose synthase/poly-beta-1,6-N-acetylglucosamine synthase-like glycosyltransferase